MSPLVFEASGPKSSDDLHTGVPADAENVPDNSLGGNTNNGQATYEFVTGDGGDVTLRFTHDTPGTVNINAIAGVIEVDGAFDPSLDVSGCIPEVADFACYSGANIGTDTRQIDVGISDPGRMILMLIFHSDVTPTTTDITAATLGGEAMSQIREQRGINTGVEMWGITNAGIDAGGLTGLQIGAYTEATPDATFFGSMCLVRLTDVDQNFPAEDLGTPSQGQVNSNSFVPDGAPLEMATSITTSANNALVLSAGVSDFTQDPNSWWNDVDPNPPMAQLFFNNNNQNPVGGTAGGSVGNKAVAGFITVTDIDIQDATTSASHIVASFNPRVAGAPEAVGFEPVVLVKTLSGNQEYRAIGNTMRSASNTAGGACSFSPSAAATSSSSTLNMPPGSTVETAYLYWSGSGEQFEADNTVDFGPTAGTLTSITADDMFYIDNVGGGGNLDYFAGFKDVTSIVAANGSVSYTLGALEVQNNTPWSDTQACAGGWAMIVVYNNSQERFRVTNLFHGFQPFQNSAFTQVPRNFRMATTDAVELLPNGQITHVTIEGDETLASGDESLGIQSAPGLETFNTLSNSFNPLQADFNSTVSRPIFAIGGTGFYEFQSGAGVNGDGYEEDTGPGTNNPPELGSSWGFDVDTHYVSGDTSAGVLWNFAQPGAEAEEITTRYSSGQDLVMLIADAISVTNFDLADLEIFKGQSGAFKVNTTAGGTYTFTVTNNGNGGISGGQASGRVLVADVMPAGLTINNISGTAWSCNVSIGNDAFICEFNIGADCDVANSCGSTDNELLGGESLPVLTASIDVGDTSFFPLLSNNVKNAGRMQHNGGSCPPLTPGVIPDPDTCARSPQYDNVNDLQGGSVDINDLDDKTTENNNVDSVITEVRGVETDLGITKSVDGILEEGETGSYTLTVTNFGPDATTGAAGGTITVTDTQPPGVTFTAVSGSGWNCPGSAFPCTYTGALAVSSSATITVNVNVTGAAGQNVTNTAAVSSGTFNFDSNTGNDSATDITAIVAPPVSSNDKFLLSVSVPTNTTEIGGLTAPDDIKNEDLFLYDPLIDVATEFYVNADAAPTYDINDANAVHLFKNGHVALSSETGGTIGASATAFQAEDIVVWDPIQDEYVETLFDGTTLLDGGSIADNNIDAVYVKDNGNILFSTAGATSITTTGSGTVSFQPGDIVEYDPVGLTATIVFDSSASNLFNAEVQVDGLYLRVDPADPDSNEDKFILSVNESPSVNVGECPGCDPVGGTFLGRDDIVEVDLTGADPVTQNLFVGDIPLGVFAPTNNDREIDAIHVVEDAYLGHFAITQSQAGSTCEAGQITISKHKGLTHDVDTDYTGSIRISTDLVIGDWAVSVGNGTLVNGTAGDGEAIYTFVPTDNGEVTLFLTVDTVNTINVDVTNNFAGFVGELGSEDPNFVFNNVITNVTYRDEFGAASYDNDDGSTFWLGDWVEGGGEADGAAAGNILINAGQLEITASPGIPNPSLQRTANLNLYTVTQAVLLNYDYTYQFINGGSDVLEVQVSTDGSAWTTVREYGAGDIAISGTNLTPQSESIDVTAAFGIVPPASGPATAYVRFLVSGGYTGTSRMFFDNVELATGTTDCGIGSIDHYEIRIDGITGTSATLVPGIQCVGSVVTITGHDLSDFPSAANETITLSTTSTGPSNGGDWTLLSGNGLLSNGTLGDGIATYAFAPGEQSVSLIFNYTAPAAEDEQVNINVSASHPVLVSEDPTLQVDLAGLLFYNETANNPVNISPIPTQIAGKPSNVLPDIRLITIEAVRTSDNDPQACSPLFDAGNTPTIGFAAECIDPAGCSASLTDQFQINGTAMTPAPDDTDPNTTSASFVDVTVPLVDQGAGRIGGNLVFSYADSGSIQIHAEYEIPLGNNPAGTLSGDSLTGVSNVFVVRPFGFDLDFSDDRFLNGLGGSSYAADANGTRFAIAEAPFDATVTAVLWQSEDDDDLVEGNDGIPDQGANLSNNARTPNYGNESTAADYDVLVSLNQIVAPTSTVGALSNNLFTNVDEGFQLQSMRFDEVGIIDLDITLVDSADGTTPIGFMGTGNILRGNLKNVGRFYPQDFQIYGTPRVIPRPLADAEPYAIGMSTFTYMGENFGLSVPVRARNADGEVTRNYIGDFAKLGDGINDFSADKFFAVEVLPGAGDDNNLSSRIAFGNPLWSTNPSISWNSNPQVDGGEGLITGNLVFERQTSGEQDGPYEDLTIAINTQDSDTVPFVLDLDIDDAVGDDAAIIDTAEFRYGRLLIDEAFGSELDPVGITFRVEYWDGTDFVLNTDDSSTTIFYDASENVSANRSLRWVGGTFQDNLVEDDNDIAEPGESFLELAAIQADTDVTRSIYQGQTLFRSNVDLDTDGFQDDSPIFASAPGEGFEGSAIVEFNLNDASLPFSLDFLSYDWRGGGVDEYDEIPDGVDYDDNPRSVVNFGSYRGHDRIINWQEIYIGPSD